MSQPSTISDLPTELILEIAHSLDSFSRICLRISCKRFMEIFHPPSHLDLLQAETAEYAGLHNLFACKDCLRLRPRAHFGDRMVKNKKDRGRKLAAGRWCVDCGINPPPGEFRYIIGNPICILGDLFVICRTCEKLKEGVKENGTALLVCRDCLQVARAAEDRIKAEKQVEERRRGQVENMGEQERRPRVRVYYNIPAGLSEYLSRLGIKVLSPEEST